MKEEDCKLGQGQTNSCQRQEKYPMDKNGWVGRQKIPHVMRKFLPFQADFRLIMRDAHTHADNFFMRMCATSRIMTQSHENYITAFILDLRLHMSQSINSQYEYLLRKPILSHTTIIFCITKPMPHCPCE